MSYSRINVLQAAAVAAALLCAVGSQAQQSAETIVRNHITVRQADIDAANGVKASSYHVMAANVPGARQRAAALNAENARRVAESRVADPDAVRPDVLTQPYFYPADLATGGGNTLKTTVFHALYVDYTGTVAANWGNPEGFLTDLGKSRFIHLADPYVGATANGRYTVGANAKISYGFFGNVIYEHELWAIVHAAASTQGYGAGAGNLYHIFLPKGIDTCFDESAECYSPDNDSTWAFCGYHTGVTFSDIGTVLFTVQPYQNVPGCAVQTPSPNGQLADSTNSVLSHETFEAITDPLPDSGWVNRVSLDLEGYEIADECQPLGNSDYDFLVPTFKINNKEYEVQLEYSNKYHACSYQP